eukprot:1335286-Amphidinium_carterae.1
MQRGWRLAGADGRDARSVGDAATSLQVCVDAILNELPAREANEAGARTRTKGGNLKRRKKAAKHGESSD